jgi:1-phosphatidylinositol phosphodiesterase
MSSLITVRNLTATSISLSHVEEFEDSSTLQTRIGGSFWRTKNTASSAPSANEIGEHAGGFRHQELGIVLEPFESFTLGRAGSTKTVEDDYTTAKISLRLTIEDSEGGQYRIDINPAYTQKSSRVFTSLSTTARIDYTALYHPSRPTAHLLIHTNHLFDYQKWMKTLPDTLSLSEISIPGTHNSHTHYRALPSVRCQVVDIKTQLEQGIRFFDIRVQPVHATDTTKKDLYLVHGSFPISLTGPRYFAPILQTCYDFLDLNPSETILISLKREGIGSATDHHLARILEEHYITPNASKWHTDTTIPCLGAARGKVVLVRRYASPNPSFGLDASPWPHNATHALFPAHPQTPTFCLQDYCDVLVPESIATKIQYSNEHLVRAAQCERPGPLYLNFLSGSNFWNKDCWPGNIAKVVNKGMEEWLCVGHHLRNAPASERHPGRVQEEGKQGGVRRRARGDGRTGIVVMDFVGDGGDWDLVRLVVGMNMGVLMRVDR